MPWPNVGSCRTKSTGAPFRLQLRGTMCAHVPGDVDLALGQRVGQGRDTRVGAIAESRELLQLVVRLGLAISEDQALQHTLQLRCGPGAALPFLIGNGIERLGRFGRWNPVGSPCDSRRQYLVGHCCPACIGATEAQARIERPPCRRLIGRERWLDQFEPRNARDGESELMRWVRFSSSSLSARSDSLSRTKSILTLGYFFWKGSMNRLARSMPSAP